MKKHIGHDGAFRECISAVSTACQMTRKAQCAALKVAQYKKSDSSPVTATDFAVQALINRKLGCLYEDIAILAEESSKELKKKSDLVSAICNMLHFDWPNASTSELFSAIDLGSDKSQKDRYWTLDPIDGTKGFIRGGQYAIALAFIDKGEVTKAIMGCPNLSVSSGSSPDKVSETGSIFFSIKGTGSWIIPDDLSTFEPTQVFSKAEKSSEIRICGSVEPLHSVTKKNDQIAKALNKKNHKLKIDSQCKYTIVSRGQADAFIRLPTDRYYVEKIWDHAAGFLIATEAGAVVSDADGKDLNFSDGEEMRGNQGIVCANSFYHGQIIDTIKELRLNQ